MNKLIPTTVVLLISILPLFAQDKIIDELKTLSDNMQFDRIIEYASRSKDYSAKSLYYIGFAYFMTEDDNNCIKFMNLSIEKDAKDPMPHYIKASTLNYMGEYNEAIRNFQTAINLKADDAEFYSGLGDSYYQLDEKELAIENYKKATEQEDCPDRPYIMIAQIYSDLGNNDKALDAYYVAKSKFSEKSNLLINVLFNIGLFESLRGNYDKAETAFTDLLQLDPEDYHTYAKLIQIYYYRKEYNKAKLYKDKLYEAHKKGVLKDDLHDMFCFDQFEWNGKLILAFERYENENKGKIYNKHIFYVTDHDGNIEYTIQTEFSPISVELGETKYILCAWKDNIHINYGIGFNDDFDYSDLKNAVIKRLEK